MTKHIFKTATSLSLLIFCSASAVAQDSEPIVTDRPDFTESTETVPRGRTQIEAGATFARTGEERSSTFGEVLVRRGLAQKTELRFEVPNYSMSRGNSGRTSNFEDGSIGFKQVISAASGETGLRKLRVSIIGGVSLPLGSRQVRSGGVLPKVKLLFGVDLTDRLSLSSNLNAASSKDDGGRFTEFSASASLSYAVNDRIGTFVELFGFSPTGGRDNTKYLNGGTTYLLNDDFQLDARVGFGVGNDVDGSDSFFGVGVSRRF